MYEAALPFLRNHTSLMTGLPHLVLIHSAYLWTKRDTLEGAKPKIKLNLHSMLL
jgi:hypothetical protein